MIGIILNDKAFEQDIRELLMAFYPGESFCHEWQPGLRLAVIGEWNEERTQLNLWLEAGEQDEAADRVPDLPAAVAAEIARIADPVCADPVCADPDSRTETKNRVKRRLYAMLVCRTGKLLPWGALTGIRPTKIALTRLDQGMREDEIRALMRDAYFASEKKAKLAVEIAARERMLLSQLDYQNGYSLYTGIPFCPTTCLYCSFTSFPIEKWRGRIDQYLGALFRELDYVAEKKRGCTLDTVYFGGGTPTTLKADELDRLLAKVRTAFDCSQLKEFTVEAGRPDSITMEKLAVLKKHGVTRISINPQTMKQETLDLIGRRHTVEEVKNKFHLAREAGFDNINMDLIVGLPEETIDDVRATMEAVKALGPDSVTVHSLAIKRAARLNTSRELYKDLTITNTEEMIGLTAAYARAMGMEPYYLYRQKNMAGNFENVGYATPGKACLYNILIMEEQQTIIGCGAGTTTKRLHREENRVERAETVKNVEQYIDRVDEMIARKEAVL